MSFDYKKVMEIAQRLEELGIPEKTIQAIKDWANERRGGEVNYD